MDNLDLEEIDLEKILEKLNQQERDIIIPLIEIDSLTRVYNKRKLERDVELAVLRADRINTNFNLLMIDIDDFKKYNDEHGHPEGDKLLREVAQCLKSGLRRFEEGVYRYGGEEFSIIIPDTDIKEGVTVGDRLRKNVENGCGVTISVGLSNYRMLCNNIIDLIDFADKALYNAKKEGKNKIKVYQGVK